MQVDAELFHVRRFGGGKHVVTLDLDPGATLEHVLARFDLEGEQGLVALVNGRQAEPDHELHDGDVVALFYQPEGG